MTFEPETVTFPPDPQLGDEVLGLDRQVWRWDGDKWVAFGGGESKQFLGISDAPNDGKQYGRQSRTWTPIVIPPNPLDDVPGLDQPYGWNGHTLAWQAVLALSGGTMTGPLTLALDPVNPRDAATMSWVQAQANSTLARANGYTASEINKVNNRFLDFSLDEQATGQKWIDGNELFQKTWVIPTSLITIGGTSYVEHGIPVIGAVTECWALTMSAFSTWVIWPTVDSLRPIDGFAGGISMNQTWFVIDSGSAWTIPEMGPFMYITVRYTKVAIPIEAAPIPEGVDHHPAIRSKPEPEPVREHHGPLAARDQIAKPVRNKKR
jgi:hypothetical protein